MPAGGLDGEGAPELARPGGIVFVGPVTVAVSLFPRYLRMAADPARRAVALPLLRLLRRISAGYAVLGISVPVLGIGVAVQLGVVTSGWLVAAMALTAGAAVLLAAVVFPQQGRLLAAASRSTPPPATATCPRAR